MVKSKKCKKCRALLRALSRRAEKKGGDTPGAFVTDPRLSLYDLDRKQEMYDNEDNPEYWAGQE